MKFCSTADVCVPKTMDISSYWISFDGYIKTCNWCSLLLYILSFYFILYLPLNPLPYLRHPMRVFSLQLVWSRSCKQNTTCIRGNPTKLGMPSAFLLSQLASLQSFCCSAESPLHLQSHCGKMWWVFSWKGGSMETLEPLWIRCCSDMCFPPDLGSPHTYP